MGGSLCEVLETARNMFLVENPVGATSWNQPSIKRLRNAPFVFEDISHLCVFGVKDRRSPRALKRPVRYLTNSRDMLKFLVRKCPNKHVHGPVKGLTNAYRSSSRWHTRAWGQAAGDWRVTPSRDLRLIQPKMWNLDLTGTAILDDEFHKEPHLEEATVPEEIPSAVRWAVMRIHKNLGHPSKEGIVVSRFTNWRSQQNCDQSCDRTEVRRLLGEQTSEKPLSCEVGGCVHRTQSRKVSGSIC